MENIIYRAKGSFYRLHGIFGITHKGMMLFTEDAIIITAKKTIDESRFSREEAKDILKYSEIEHIVCTWRDDKIDPHFQVVTRAGQKCGLTLAAPLNPELEAFLGEKATYYKNPLEKELGLTTKSESEIFALMSAKHISGLPIAEGVPVKIAANKERLLFIHNSQEMSLSAEKIQDVSIKTDAEIQSTYVSSIGNALLGAHFFGTAGAVIGGQAREKRTTIETHFLVISYIKQGEPAYLSFQIENLKCANVICSYFNSKTAPLPQRMEL